MDLKGRDVRVEGKAHSFALEASEEEATQQFMFNTRGSVIGKMRLRKLCRAIIYLLMRRKEETRGWEKEEARKQLHMIHSIPFGSQKMSEYCSKPQSYLVESERF